jgi:CRISPR-associated protein Csc3
MVDEMIYGPDFEPDDELGIDVDDLDVLLPDLTIQQKAPMFQVLFESAVAGDPILISFAEHVVGKLSDYFATKAAKGGAFFQTREAEEAENTARYQHDQNLRAHLINGILPVIRIARNLTAWSAPYFEDWDPDVHERLLITGYMLHDYTKIDDVKRSLKDAGFKEYDAPSESQMPVLRDIFATWCTNLGLDNFLKPIGGAQPYLEDLIYIAVNTQAMKGTARNLRLYGRLALTIEELDLITYLSRLADLIAYITRTPRDVVAHETIRRLILTKLAFNEGKAPIAKLVYHHIAENRGLLLNFIHNGVIQQLANDQRVPLLYAPSGVVYLEHRDAPPMPNLDALVDTVVANIRQDAGERIVTTGTGSQLNKDGLRIGETFRDFFDLPELIARSYRLVTQIRTNAPKYMEYLETSGWPHTDSLPLYSKDKSDVRLRQMAEWASLLETQFEERLPESVDAYIDFIFEEWGLTDLRANYEELRDYKQPGVGIRHRWYWVAAHALDRQHGVSPERVLTWLQSISEKLAQQLASVELPESSKSNQMTWDELRNYVKSVLTVKGDHSENQFISDELTNYTNAKVKRGQASCTLCGSNYQMRDQIASAVAFQPNVYSQRTRIGKSDNKRSICTICATEQLLRQLFISVENLPTGRDLEAQNVRYLSLYPVYFYSQETLHAIYRAYRSLQAIRLSDRDFAQLLRKQLDLRDPQMWQRLDQFLLFPDVKNEEKSFEKVLRYEYSKHFHPTYFTAGFRASFRDITETESWVLPVFLSLVLSINLDVKIVVSDSGVPLMLESSELPETLWFDGIHPAIQQLIAVRYDPQKDERKLEPRSRLDIDSLTLALARLTAAYLIHLDTEYAPPKENWQRFTPIANALCESPLYVFHYLKKQERESENKPITHAKIQRYLHYAKLFNIQGDKGMTHASKLVNLYRGFYRAKTMKNANSILRPLNVVSDALLVANQKLFTDTEALIEVAYGEIYRFMERVGSGQADGRFPKGVSAEERRQDMREFARYFVVEVFEDAFHCDVAALRGKQLNLLKSACEVLYRDAQYQEWAERGGKADDDSDEN